MALLRVEGLTCERDDRVLFQDLSFEVGSGEVIQIEGPNGAGKTTLLRILGGLLLNWEGELYWKDRPMSEARTEILANLLYIGHKPGVKAVLGRRENVRDWIELNDPRNVNKHMAMID